MHQEVIHTAALEAIALVGVCEALLIAFNRSTQTRNRHTGDQTVAYQVSVRLIVPATQKHTTNMIDHNVSLS